MNTAVFAPQPVPQGVEREPEALPHRVGRGRVRHRAEQGDVGHEELGIPVRQVRHDLRAHRVTDQPVRGGARIAQQGREQQRVLLDRGGRSRPRLRRLPEARQLDGQHPTGCGEIFASGSK